MTPTLPELTRCFARIGLMSFGGPAAQIAMMHREIVDERDRRYGPDETPDGVRVWCSYDTARGLVNDSVGEALCWNGEEVRWRHRTLDPAGRSGPAARQTVSPICTRP